MKEIAIIIVCILVEIILLFLTYKVMDALDITDSIYRVFHPKYVTPLPPVKEYGRRCSECNWPLKDANIYLVREDERIGGITNVIKESLEGELKEAIDCPICGHQNIIGKFYRPLEPENVKTINDIRRAAGFEPVESLKPYDVTIKPESLRTQASKTLNDYDELIHRIVDGAQEDNNGQQ